MSEQSIKVKVFRWDPSAGGEPRYEVYEVPWTEGFSAMNALDYIYQNLDSTLAYYDHAGCDLGICGRCTGRINGEVGLFCQTPVEGEVTLEPLSRDRVLRDLVTVKPIKEDAMIQEEQAEKRDDMGSVSILVRREIEALIAAPLIKAFMEEFGKERVLEVARKVIKSLALESGKMMSAFAGGNSLEHLAKVTPLFSMGGALETEPAEAASEKIGINVVRCRFAEMYKEHGIEEFGYLLSCGRDYALMEGFNPKIIFTRTQTIMEGADYCDFRFTGGEE